VADRAAERDRGQSGPTRGEATAPGRPAAGALLADRPSPRQLLQLQRLIGNRATRRIAARRLLQRSPAMIPFTVSFDRPLTRDEFIALANAQLGLDPKRGAWNNVRAHYEASDSPVTVQVAASLVTTQRTAKSGAELGLDTDDTGRLAGAQERVEAFAGLSEQERAQLYTEVDRRYWAAKGGKRNKISSRSAEPGNAALWDQIRDEVLAQREFVQNLPEKASQVMHIAADGIALRPQDFEQVVRIANKIERMADADLENYLTGAGKATSLDALERAVDDFLAIRDAAPAKLKELLDKTSTGDSDVDSVAAALAPETMFYLSLEQRLKVIREVAEGTLVGDEDERTIIRLLTSTPSADVAGLLTALKADGGDLLKLLEKVIDGEENKLYYAALRQLVFRTLDPATAQRKMQDARILPWSDPGVMKAYYKVRFYYETVELTKDGKVRVVYWTNIAGTGIKNPEQLFEPDEIIGLQFHLDESFAGAVEGETIFMPALNMLAFKNEQFSRELHLIADIGLLFAGGAGLIAKGTRLAKAIALLDTAVAAAAIAINSYRSDIAKSPEGMKFLRAWDTVNTLIAVYGLGRLVVGLPEVFRNLRTAYREFRAKPGTLSPEGLGKVEKETEKLLGHADDALFENQIAGLSSRYGEKLGRFEKQLEKARGVTDAAAREKAIKDIESQIAAQEENAALIAELKKANPTKSNKEIAELAKPRIKVPNVPLGMTAEEFAEAQKLIKGQLDSIGIKDAEGFVTGSRITGVTFNPKKTSFGSVSGDLAGKDFDITLITSRAMTRSETEALQRAFQAKFGFPLGIRNVVDKRQLDFLPIYGKLDLTLK
jgi:hypothetical protein